MSNKKYDDIVAKGKELLKKIDCYQIKIVEYALEVCEIGHGGHSGDKYTIKRYAKDIGMCAKTLINWMSIYRNVIVKLKDPVTTNDEWKAARRTDNILSREARLRGVKLPNIKKSKALIPNSIVRDLYKDEINEPSFRSEFRTLMNRSQRIAHLLKTRDMNLIEDCELLRMMELLDKASDEINNHLTKKKKRVA